MAIWPIKGVSYIPDGQNPPSDTLLEASTGPQTTSTSPPIRQPVLEEPPIEKEDYFSATLISTLTSPYLTSPLFILLTGLHFVRDLGQIMLYGLVAVGFTIAIPLAYTEHLRRAGRVDSIHIFDQDARIGPLALTGASSMVGFAVLYAIGAPDNILRLGALLFLLAGAVLLATAVLKISGHVSAWSAGTTVVAVLWGPLAWAAILGVLPIAWSRLALGKHTRREVLAGFGYGIAAAAVLSLVVGLW